ncbi:MAG: hypothetical protein PWR00_1254, partial [Thermovirga sp.]|nr:hypothetical protein [Thermovirga sp.]
MESSLKKQEPKSKIEGETMD